MVKKHIEKSDVFSRVLGVGEDLVPCNDLVAWVKFPKYRDIYDRLKIAKWQGLYHGVMPLEPLEESYPVVLKPIVNLYGMGNGTYLIRDRREWLEHWGNCGVWMEMLEGRHLSFDLVLVRGRIVWWSCFEGVKDEMRGIGYFDYWKSLLVGSLEDGIEDLPKNVKMIVEKELRGYSGCVNVETIGGYVIEAHLRMGDLDLHENLEVMGAIAEVYQGGGWSLGGVELGKVYFIPIWNKMVVKWKGELRKCVMEIFKKYGRLGVIRSYKLEDGRGAKPSGDWIRVGFLVIIGDLEMGLKCREDIYGML